MEKKTEGFIIGFVTSVIASIASLYIYQKYIAEKAATAAVQQYQEKTMWKPLTKTELENIKM